MDPEQILNLCACKNQEGRVLPASGHIFISRSIHNLVFCVRLFLFKDTLFNLHGLFRSTELTASGPQAGAEQGFSTLRVLFVRRVPASLYSEARQHCSPALGAILNREIASKAQRCGKRGTKKTTREDAYLQRVKQDAVSPSSTPAGTMNFK